MTAAELNRCLLPLIGALVLSSGVVQAQSEWMSFASEDRVFEASFPDMPKSYVERRVKNGVMSVNRLMGAGNERFFCYAGYTDYSQVNGETARPELEKVRDDFINGSFATLLEDRAVTLPRSSGDGLTANRFIAIGDERRYTSIIALDGTRVYQVIASTIRFGFKPDDIEHCLTGFKLTPQP